MEIKPIHTFAELQEAASKQHLRIDERNGKYRVVRKISERFVVVEAGAGYSLDQEGLREFLLFNTVGIGERLTDWSGGHGHKPNDLHVTDPIPGSKSPLETEKDNFDE